LNGLVSAFVDAGDLAVHHWIVGAGDPVVLLHGGLATADEPEHWCSAGAVSEQTPTYVEVLRKWGFTAPGEVDLDRIAVGDDMASMRAAHLHAASCDQWERFLRQIADLWLTVPSYSEGVLATIEEPTLVVTGDCDEVSDLGQAQRLLASIPGAELAIVPGAGHDAADRTVFWGLMVDFLDRAGSDRAGRHPNRGRSRVEGSRSPPLRPPSQPENAPVRTLMSASP